MSKLLCWPLVASASVLAFSESAEASFLQVDPVGYKDGINLYSYVQNDPVNRIDPDGTYSCGKNLSSAECGQFTTAQNVAIRTIQGGVNTLQSARDKLTGGEKLSSAERSAVRAIGSFFGAGSTNASGINRAIGNAQRVLGELRSVDKPAFAGNNGYMAVTQGRFGVQLDRANFFNSRYSTLGNQAFALAHEAGHTSGLAPTDFGISGSPSVRAYGYDAAITRGAVYPWRTWEHADTVPYAFGLHYGN